MTKKQPLEGEMSPDQETEICILGGILLDTDNISKVVQIIKPEYFSFTPYGKTYEVMMELNAKDGFDPAILRQELEKRGIDAGGGNAISDWMTFAGYAGKTTLHAKRLVEQWRSRKFEEACYNAIEKINSGENIDVVYGELRKIEDELSIKFVGKVFSTKEMLEENRSNNKYGVVSTGYSALNDYFGGGFEKGTVTIIGAGTSIGKSQFAICCMLRGYPEKPPVRCLYVVQEMSLGTVEDRMMSVVANTPQGACKKFRLNKANKANKVKKETVEKYYSNYSKHLNLLKEIPIHIHANGIVTAEEFRALVAKYHKDIDLVVLDYIQQCGASKPNQGSRERIDEISRTCKDLATNYNVAIVALAQLSRDGAKAGSQDGFGRPKLWHLKESGSIEQDADNVILLYREKKNNVAIETLEVEISKNRHGEIGRLYFYFDLTTGYITDKKEKK